MVKSGLIIGAVSFLLVLGSASIISPICAPCIGLFLGLVAGYLAGVFDKPVSNREAIRKGGIAGAIAGGLGFIGGLIGGVINGALLNPSSIGELYKMFGLPNPSIGQAEIWVMQLGGAFCIGLFNIAWMAIMGIAGGALWFQITGKNRIGTMMPPQEPTATSF